MNKKEELNNKICEGPPMKFRWSCWKLNIFKVSEVE